MRNTPLLLAATMALSANAQPVEPAQAFRWQQLELRAPASEGWVLVSRTNHALAFMRRSVELARSEVATVSVFKLPGGLDHEGFSRWVHAAVQAESPPSRFRPVDAQSAQVNERGYACIVHRSLSHDLQARGVPAAAEPPLLHQHALYCRHPDRADTGFAAAFSTRGPAVDTTLADRARSFIEGVVPERPAP